MAVSDLGEALKMVDELGSRLKCFDRSTTLAVFSGMLLHAFPEKTEVEIAIFLRANNVFDNTIRCMQSTREIGKITAISVAIAALILIRPDFTPPRVHCALCPTDKLCQHQKNIQERTQLFVDFMKDPVVFMTSKPRHDTIFFK